jgi:mitochondrial import receptor subunit TOM40
MESTSLFMAMFNYRLFKGTVFKSNATIQDSVLTLRPALEYTGSDFFANIDTQGISIMEGGLTGIVMANYLQSVTPSLSLGLRAQWQRQALNYGPQLSMSYLARYAGNDWVATGELAAGGLVQATFWRQIAQKVSAGVNLELLLPGGQGSYGFGASQTQGHAIVGAKYTFASSLFRAQVDSAGKISCVLEKEVAPPVRMVFAAEVDQFKVLVTSSIILKLTDL